MLAVIHLLVSGPAGVRSGCPRPGADHFLERACRPGTRSAL